MRDRFRTFDSKITFFAFADIITAVSGMLIFITLLLATDLGRPTDNRSESANSEVEKQLHETTSEQAEVDAQNQRLQGLLVTADTAPDPEKLQADIARLRVRLAEARQKQIDLAERTANSRRAIEARDKTLGLTELNARVQGLVQEDEAIELQEAKARTEMTNLEQQVIREQSKVLKLSQREGQLWLIPDRSGSTKEAILVTVTGDGATVERFDHPEEHKQLDKLTVNSSFRSYLHGAKATDQSVVFEVKPSGIDIFQDLLKSARSAGFEVGYDALEEDRQVHFSTPPVIDDSVPPAATPSTVPSGKTSASGGNSGSPPNGSASGAPPQKPQPAAAKDSSTPDDRKGWWQSLVELAHRLAK